MLTDPLACNDISPEAYAPPVVPGPVILNLVIVSVSVSVALIVISPVPESLATVQLVPPLRFTESVASPAPVPPGTKLRAAPPVIVVLWKSYVVIQLLNKWFDLVDTNSEIKI